MTQIVIRRRIPRMRSWFLLALLGLVAALAWALPAPANPPDDPVWRRTRQGWEQLDRRAYERTTRDAVFHPLCLATLEVLLVAMALVAGDGTAIAGFRSAKARPFAERRVTNGSEDGDRQHTTTCDGTAVLRRSFALMGSIALSGKASSLVHCGRLTSWCRPHLREPNESSWVDHEQPSSP